MALIDEIRVNVENWQKHGRVALAGNLAEQLTALLAYHDAAEAWMYAAGDRSREYIKLNEARKKLGDE